MSKLVEVHFLEVATRGESAVLALRWEATGPGGRLFPPLDADMSLTPQGSILPGYRWPGSTGLRSLPWARGPDRAVVHEVADVTVRSLLARVADVLTRPPESAGAVQRTGITRAAAPGRTRNALTRLPSGRRIRRTADQAGGDRTRRS